MTQSLIDFFQICSPLSLGCTVDWEAWAAIGTFLAILAALLSSTKASRLIERHRREDRDNSIATIETDRIATADRLALALDYELYRYGNDLVDLANSLKTVSIYADPLGAVDHLHSGLRREAMPLLSRFIDQVGVFGTEGASKLTLVMGTYQSLLESAVSRETLASAPEEVLRVGMVSVRLQLVKAANQVTNARNVLAPYADKFRQGRVDIAAIEEDQPI